MCVSHHFGSFVIFNYFSFIIQERDGWYTTHAIERIKIVLRTKYFSILEGHRATDEDCKTILDSGSLGGTEGNSRMVYWEIRRLRPGKHNMAKGAQRPEEVVVRCPLTLLRKCMLIFFVGNAPSG